jgi:hypothetical protein
MTTFTLLLIHNQATSTSTTIVLYRTPESSDQNNFTMSHEKNQWCTLSSSEHNRHVLSLIWRLLKLSLVSNLLWETNHRKTWTLGGMLKFQRARRKTGVIPLKLMTAYYNVWCKSHAKASSTSENSLNLEPLFHQHHQLPWNCSIVKHS